MPGDNSTTLTVFASIGSHESCVSTPSVDEMEIGFDSNGIMEWDPDKFLGDFSFRKFAIAAEHKNIGTRSNKVWLGVIPADGGPIFESL